MDITIEQLEASFNIFKDNVDWFADAFWSAFSSNKFRIFID